MITYACVNKYVYMYTSSYNITNPEMNFIYTGFHRKSKMYLHARTYAIKNYAFAIYQTRYFVSTRMAFRNGFYCG